MNQRTAARFRQVSRSEVNARDRTEGSPLPEAPRLTVDGVIGTYRLPSGLSVKTEFEYVKAKPLGDRSTGLALRELRMELNKSLQDGRWTIFANGQWLHGYSGQTLEAISVNSAAATERPVGVPVVSYATLALRYNFDR